MHRTSRTGFVLLLVSASSLFAGALKEQQVWTSVDSLELTASVLELDRGSETVRMKRNDGLIFTIKFEKFESTDAERLRQAAQQPEQPPKEPQEKEPEKPALPNQFEWDDVPMVRQKGAFCVPASASMIAGFHGIDTDQDQIAFLSSAGSFNNQGTNPRDMFLAMKKLGFQGRARHWRKAEDFHKSVLPTIRRALVNHGPIYISFKSGVFGNSGHGCVIIGYDDRQEELIFHNPWGNVFEKKYEAVATQGHGVVQIFAPDPAPIADELFIQTVRNIIPEFDGNIAELPQLLERAGQEHELVWCSRRDARDDKRFAADTARDDGRMILDLAFHRNPAVLIPGNNDGKIEKYLFVTRPPEGGARFLAREITADGWSEPELVTLGSLTRYWPTRIESGDAEKFIWELPMIELHPDD